MRFYTKETPVTGHKMITLPNGFVVCQDVAIGRTGMMIYGPGQTPVKVGLDGVSYIEREPEELFKPETLASFNGVPVTNDHPAGGNMVYLDNWRDLAMGYVMNTRRGEGANDDLMIADLVLTDPNIIEDVRNGKRDVSSGYDNDYYEISPGHGRQVNIVGNHVALVARGRCGTRCSIHDHANTSDCSCKGDKTMGMMFKDFTAKVIKAWKNSKNEDELSAALNDIGVKAKTTDEEGIHIHAGGKYDDDTLDKKFSTHDEALEDHEERITGLEKDKTKTTDAAFDTAVQKGIARALKAMGLDQSFVSKLRALHTRDAKMRAKDGEKECPECEGSGRDDDNGKECPKCHGEGYVTTDAAEESEEEKERKKKEAEAKDNAVEAEEPKAKGTRDSAALEESFKQTLALAEIIVPGIHAPTFDAASAPFDTVTSLCGLRRKTLDKAALDDQTQSLVLVANGGKPFNTRTATCDSVRSMFLAVGALKKAANNTNDTASLERLRRAAGQDGSKPPLTIAEVNKRNREHQWKN